MNQTEAILEHLKAGNKLTPIDALNLFGCFRLAARISDLRREGHNVLVENVTCNGKTFAEYRLEEGLSRRVPASFFVSQPDLEMHIPTVAIISHI
jgi:hypothetical protein